MVRPAGSPVAAEGEPPDLACGQVALRAVLEPSQGPDHSGRCFQVTACPAGAGGRGGPKESRSACKARPSVTLSPQGPQPGHTRDQVSPSTPVPGTGVWPRSLRTVCPSAPPFCRLPAPTGHGTRRGRRAPRPPAQVLSAAAHLVFSRWTLCCPEGLGRLGSAVEMPTGGPPLARLLPGRGCFAENTRPSWGSSQERGLPGDRFPKLQESWGHGAGSSWGPPPLQVRA